MLKDRKIWVATDEDNKPVFLLPHMSNRHGLIAGATGTGKTVTLKVIAEGFSDMGVPVFLGDIKGDLSGMYKLGETTEKVTQRMESVGKPLNETVFQPLRYPTVFWDVYGEQGHPIRTSVNEMGPLLLSRMLSLNEVQSGVLNILFRIAADENLPMITIQDIRDALVHVAESSDRYTVKYGNISRATVGAIQRALAVLEDQGGNVFFGSPVLDLQKAWMRDEEGRGFINILACDKLFLNPLMYSTFMLWMLTKLYEILPERGDQEKPVMVFFFDEAHLMFDNCNRQLLEKTEQVVRLIRSKGVGVYFITQSAADVPQNILGQLSNRVQHALRAYTPMDQKAVKVAAQTFRANPFFNTEKAITQLKTGEALISFLDSKGAPCIVTRATVLPPQSYMGVISEEERALSLQETSYVNNFYEEIDYPQTEETSEDLESSKTEYVSAAEQQTATAFPTPDGAKAKPAVIYQQMPAYWQQPIQPVSQQTPVQAFPQQSVNSFQATSPVSMIPVFETNPVTHNLEAAYKDPVSGKIYFFPNSSPVTIQTAPQPSASNFQQPQPSTSFSQTQAQTAYTQNASNTEPTSEENTEWADVGKQIKETAKSVKKWLGKKLQGK